MASIPVSPVNPAHRNPLTCPHCYSKRIIRYGTLAFRRQTVQRFRCGAWNRTRLEIKRLEAEEEKYKNLVADALKAKDATRYEGDRFQVRLIETRRVWYPKPDLERLVPESLLSQVRKESTVATLYLKDKLNKEAESQPTQA